MIRKREVGGPREISEVNIVPLADVSLVLLIILMVISPMMARHALKIKSAASPSGTFNEPPPPPGEELVLTVGIHPRGFTLGGRYFEEEGSLMAQMAEELSRREDRKVFVLPDPEVTHGKVLALLERLSAGGAESVALVETEPEAPGAGP